MMVVSMRTLITPSLHLPKPQAQTSAAFFSFAAIPVFSVSHSFVNFGLTKFPMDSRRSAVSCKASHSSAFSAPGEIHVVLGPMFSGKTTTLLRRILAEREIGRKTAIIKSNKDTRYSIESIVTHDGEKLPCWALADLSSFRQKFGLDAYNQLDVIGIDEAQFFGDLYEFCREAADNDGKTVIVAGLDGDYLRRRFGSVLDIIPLADTVTKLTSRCEICGKKALFTLRKTEETETEVIGGAEVYMPVCRSHYVSGKGVMVTARGLLDSQCSLYT